MGQQCIKPSIRDPPKSEEHFLASDLLVPCPVLYLVDAKHILAQSYGHPTLLKGIPSRYIYIYLYQYIYNLRSHLLDNVCSAPPHHLARDPNKDLRKNPTRFPSIQSIHLRTCGSTFASSKTQPRLRCHERDPLVRQQVSTNGRGPERIWKRV